MGVFPARFKKNIVVAITKKTNLHNIDNLRPISLLPVLSKVLEKFIKTRLLGFKKKIV